MGHLSILLWKNFCWCKRHYLKTALFYLVPFAFGAVFLILLKREMPVTNSGDCDYMTFALPPSKVSPSTTGFFLKFTVNYSCTGLGYTGIRTYWYYYSTHQKIM